MTTISLLAKALYRLNKEAKQLRDIRRAVLHYDSYPSDTLDVLEEVYPDAFVRNHSYYTMNGGVLVVCDGDGICYDDKDQAERNLLDCEFYWTDEELEDSDMSDEKKAEYRKMSKEMEKEFDNLCDAFYYLERLEGELSMSINDIYRKKDTLVKHFAQTGVFPCCGVHEFPNGDIRRCYEIGGYTFHGEDISRVISDKEYENSVTQIDEISAENKLAQDMSYQEALDIIEPFYKTILRNKRYNKKVA